MAYGFNEDKSKAEIYVAIAYPASSHTIQPNSTGVVDFWTYRIGGEIIGVKKIIFCEETGLGRYRRTRDLAITGIVGYEDDTAHFNVEVRNTSTSAIKVSSASQAFLTCIAGTVREVDLDDLDDDD